MKLFCSLMALCVGLLLSSDAWADQFHRVKKGETLYRIAKTHGVSVKDLKRANDLPDSLIMAGQKLRIPEDEENFNSNFHEPEETGEGGNPLISFASKHLGVPYRFGGENPKKGIDCSAFVQRVFQHFDINLPRTAREQFKAGVRVSQGELQVGDLQIGDLIFFRTYARFPSHVGIYVGEGKMIHASSRYRKVSITSVDQPYYKKRFIGVVRIQNTPSLM